MVTMNAKKGTCTLQSIQSPSAQKKKKERQKKKRQKKKKNQWAQMSKKSKNLKNSTAFSNNFLKTDDTIARHHYCIHHSILFMFIPLNVSYLLMK